MEDRVHGKRTKSNRSRALEFQRKMDVVLRLLRGEDLDAIARELKLKPERIVEWRDALLASGQAGLKSRGADGRDDEIRRLKTKIGDLTMDNELLNERIDRFEDGSGPQSRRSKQ